MQIDREALWADHMALAAITEPDRPYTRRPFSDLHRDGRAWLAARFRDAGLSVATDPGGSLIGRREGREAEAPVILTGSHSDTVPAGGRFDGISGVLAGLAVARALETAGITLRHPFEVADFLAEEPSDFGLSCIGSRAISGGLEPGHLERTDGTGRSLAEAIGQMGGDPARIAEAQRPPGSIRAMLEMHIEQGRVLEHEGMDIGVVETIVAIRRWRIAITGQADHAGTTPMALRRDALAGAARLVAWIADEATARAAGGPDYLVATVGALEVFPNAFNVIPERVELVLDIRAGREAALEALWAELEAALPDLLEGAGLRAEATLLSRAAPAACDADLQALIARSAAARGFRYRALPSGAGHDAGWIARIAPAAMIFVPCRDGISHSAEEWAEPEQLARGADVLLDTVLAVDRA